MKYLIAALILLLTLPGVASGAVNGGAITGVVNSNTSVTITLTTLASEVDSVIVAKIVATDTLYCAVIDSTTVVSTITGIPPNQTGYYFVIGRSGGLTAYSNYDTLTTHPPDIQDNGSVGKLLWTELVRTATSWQPTTETESFTINGTAATDSSAVYEVWPNNNLLIKTTQAGDSTVFMLYVHYGYREMVQTGSWFGFDTSVDSLAVIAPGTHSKTLTANVAAPSMYFTLGSYAGNGKNAAVSIELTRSRW